LHVVAHGKLAIFLRRLFTILSVLSLVLCFGTTVLWIHSYFRAAGASYGDTEHYSIRSERGHVELWTYRPYGFAGEFRYGTWPAKPRSELKELAASWRGVGTSVWFLGFAFVAREVPPTVFRAIAIPHWFLALFFAVLPVLYLRARLRSRRRHRIGLCRRCGYDLRATPDRCPECGTFTTADTENTRSTEKTTETTDEHR
jgi:hypothetical protein